MKKKNKGVTLIELMIFIAIFSIVLRMTGFNNYIWNQYKMQESVMLDQAKVVKFRKLLNLYLKDTKSFKQVSRRQLIADNFYLKVTKYRNKLTLNGKIFKFEKFEIGNFNKLDDKLATINIKNGNNEYDLYLVAGINESDNQIVEEQSNIQIENPTSPNTLENLNDEVANEK